MITILSNNRPRSGGGRAVGWRDAGYKPALANACQALDTGQSGSLNLESANMSNPVKKNLRVANPQGLKRLLVVLNVLVTIWTLTFADVVNLSTANPAPNSSLSSIQEITLEFDIEQFKQDNPTVTTWYISGNVFGGTPEISLKKGDVIVDQIQQATSIVTGNSITISFDNPIVLEAGVDYVLHIAENSFGLLKARRNGLVAKSAEINISYKGKESETAVLSLSEVLPAKNSILNRIGTVDFTFNEEVSLAEEAFASIIDTSDSNPINSVPLVLKENGKTVIVDFNNIILYNTHNYIVEIPENSIFLKGNMENGYQKISIEYSGASYKSFGYGRISPKNNAEISYLANIEVPVNCSDSEYLGRDFKATMQLYKMDGENAVAVGEPVECDVNGTAKGFIAPFYLFDLEPSTSYQVVLEADQFCLWDYETQKPMRDTANERLVLNYTTPAAIAPLPRQGFKSTAPDGTEPIENLTSLRVDFAPYEFEDVFYYPVFPSTLTEGYNLVKFVDVTTGDESSFPVEIKWDDANNYWLENSSEINYTLLKGHDYQVVIPAGMFRCRLAELGDNSANEEYAINFKGATRTEFDVTFILAEVGSMKSVVAAGKTLSVDLAGTEDWKVSAVLFNGEAVETAGDTYTTPAIEDDATIEVEYEYAREIDYNFTTGVDMTEICPYGVVSEGENLIISGVQPGDAIAIYTTGGLKVADLPAVPSGMDIVAVSIPTGQAYIILINGKSLKFLHQ